MSNPDASEATLRLCAPSELALDADFPPLSMALLDVLLRRRSCREFSEREPRLAVLSRLLWAAFGINRPGESGRTAPSAQNKQEMRVYVALAGGLYLYDARAHLLQLVVADDLRAATGGQDFVATVPVNLIYVAELDPVPGASRVEQEFYAALDTGHISQNVYLFCAAEGLATVSRGQIDRPALERLMRLPPGQHVILAQSVGYPPSA
jgi:SagB-type dehydrogenase family enzyme